MKTALPNSQSDTQGDVNQFYFFIGESADIIGQYGFREANKFIAINSAVMFQPFFYADFNLGGNIIIFGINGSANNRRKGGVNNRLSGDNHENTVTLRIIFISLIDPVKITSFHKSSKSRYIFWYDSTSIASALSLSAFWLIISMSLASDLCIGSLPAEIGKKRISALPAGTSGGTSIVSLWLTGISTVCVKLIIKT